MICEQRHRCSVNAHIDQAIKDLRRLPNLATEVWLTWNCPNPSSESERRHSPVTYSQPPTDLAVLDILDTSPSGILWLLGDYAGIEMNAELVQWSWVCDNAAKGLWRDDPLAAGWMDDETGQYVYGDVTRIVWMITRQLENLARVPKTRAIVCPNCDEAMTLTGEVLVCPNGHEHPGPNQLELQWRRKPARTAKEIVNLFQTEMGVTLTEQQMRQWAARGKLPRAGEHARQTLFLPWDVLACVMPEVVALLDEKIKHDKPSQHV